MTHDPSIPPSVAPPTPWHDRARKALVVGVGRYQCPELHDLDGCCNDAVRLGAVLAEHFDFGVVHLLDEQATRTAILGHLAALLESSRAEQEVVFCFSGHGSRILSRDHGSFETLVPHDSHRPDAQGRRTEPNRDLTDRELYGWILRVSENGARVTLLIDACRGGGIVRDLEVRPRGVQSEVRRGVLEDKIAFLMPESMPGPMSSRRVNPATPQTRRALSSASGWLPPSDRYTLLAACQADEYCREMIDSESGQCHGILSHHVARELTRLRRPTSWRELRDTIDRRITADNPGQHMQLEGVIDRQIFNGAWLQPEPFASVLKQDSDAVVLDLGSAHGVVRGSTWQLFPATTRRPEGEALATVRVEQVGATRTRARLETPVGDAKGPATEEWIGRRAFEKTRSLEVGWRIFVAPPDNAGQALLRAIERSPVLLCVNEPAAADLVIHRVEPRRKEVPHGPAPKLFPLQRPHWVFVDRDGGQKMPARPLPPAAAADLTREHLVEEIIRDLERLARYHFLHALEHPEPERSLARHVKVELLRKPPKDPWSRLDPTGAVSLGNRLALRLERQPGAPERLYVAALDLGLTGAVTLLYPRRAQRAPWTEHPLEIGLRTDDQMFVQLPKNYPFEGESGFTRGLETVLLFLTTRWTDFDGLSQKGVGTQRSRADSPLPAILDRGLGRTMRSSDGDNLLDGPEHWGLIVYPFEVVG